MKIPRIANAISNIDDELLVNAEASGEKKRGVSLMKIGALAACFILIFTAALLVLPRFIDSENQPDTEPAEIGFGENYVYRVDEGDFSTYVAGKVIDEGKLGEKIGTLTVTAGWENGSGERLSEEHLRAEVYLISDVSRKTAVALRFLDKGEALTLTHYYVIINPDVEPVGVEEYVIIEEFISNSEVAKEGDLEGIVEISTEAVSE